MTIDKSYLPLEKMDPHIQSLFKGTEFKGFFLYVAEIDRIKKAAYDVVIERRKILREDAAVKDVETALSEHFKDVYSTAVKVMKSSLLSKVKGEACRDFSKDDERLGGGPYQVGRSHEGLY